MLDNKAEGNQEISNDLYHVLIELAETEKLFCEQIGKVVKVLENEHNRENIRKFLNKKFNKITRKVLAGKVFENFGVEKSYNDEQELKYQVSWGKKESITRENYQQIIDLYKMIGVKNNFRTSLSSLQGFVLFLIPPNWVVDEKVRRKYVDKKTIILQKDNEGHVNAFFIKGREIVKETLVLSEKALEYLKLVDNKNEIVEIKELSNIHLVEEVARKCDYTRFDGINYQETISELLSSFYYYDFTNMISAIIKASKIFEFYLTCALNDPSFNKLPQEDKGVFDNLLITPVQRIPRLILLVAEITKKILTEETLADLKSIWRKLGRIASFYNEYQRNITADPFKDELPNINIRVADEISKTVIMPVKSKIETSLSPEESIKALNEDIHKAVRLMEELTRELESRNSNQSVGNAEEDVEKEKELEKPGAQKNEQKKEETRPSSPWVSGKAKPKDGEKNPSNLVAKDLLPGMIAKELEGRQQQKRPDSNSPRAAVDSSPGKTKNPATTEPTKPATSLLRDPSRTVDLTNDGTPKNRVRRRDLLRAAVGDVAASANSFANSVYSTFAPPSPATGENSGASQQVSPSNSNHDNNSSGNNNNDTSTNTAPNATVLARIHGGGGK